MRPIERAARALCELDGNPPGATMDGKPLWQDYLPEVRAVIAAIRDIDGGSPAPLAAGKEALYSCMEDPELQDARGCWHAMIDALLKDGLKRGIDWLPIEDIPDAMRDGRLVLVKRVYEGRVVKEGWACFTTPAQGSPMCEPIGPDPLGRSVDLIADAAAAARASTTKRWLNPDRMHAFPQPTHFAQTNPATLSTIGGGDA